MSGHLKVLRIVARLNIGGPARHVMVLQDRLPALGFETRLVFGGLAQGEATLEAELNGQNGRVIKIPQLSRSIRPWRDLRSAWRIWGVLRREQPDIVHTHTSKAGLLGRLMAAAYNLPRRPATRALVVHTFHGHVFSGYFGPVTGRAVRGAERALARLTDVVVAISFQQRADLVVRHHIAGSGKVQVVPLGLEIEPLLALPRSRPTGPAADARPVRFGFLGRFVPIKDLATLIEAFARARRENPDVRLRLFGDGPMRSALEEQARKLGLFPDVEFSGWQLDRPRIYADLDAVVITSRNEGTPVALIEAHAAGLPAVATDVGGVRDVVRDQETGLLVPSGDADAVARAMLQLAASFDLRWRMGQAGRDWVAPRFAAGRLADDINRLYRGALARKRAGRGH